LVCFALFFRSSFHHLPTCTEKFCQCGVAFVFGMRQKLAKGWQAMMCTMSDCDRRLACLLLRDHSADLLYFPCLLYLLLALKLLFPLYGF